ncbi:MAG: peptidylprolyl isomerase [Ferruginibacter sp.]|nr:peptidylprolyl isomerase [Ferruginibacter sp.]
MLKYNILLTIVFSLNLSTTFSQSKKVLADKIIAVVGNKIIMKSDLESAIQEMISQGVEPPADANCLLLEQRMISKALVLQAEKDSINVSEEEVEADIDNQIRFYIRQLGSKEEVERTARRTIYQIKEDFRESFRDRKLSSLMKNKIVDGIKITPNEAKAYFETIPKDSLPFYETQLEIGQIVIYPKASRDAEEYCIEQLSDYKRQIESGNKDFATLASIFTDDPGSKASGGRYEINRNQKDLDNVWLSKSFTLKEGQVSNPFKSKFGYHIIQLVSRAGDDAVVRHILKIPPITQYEIKDAMSKMDTVRSKLITGIIDFGVAVSRYSDDEGSKFTAGMLQSRNGGTSLSIDELDKDLVMMLNELKVGEYSKPVEFVDERGKKGVRIVYLKTKTEPHRENLKDDYNKIAQRALEVKKENTLERWFNEKIKTYYIMIDDEYKNCESLKKWVKNVK